MRLLFVFLVACSSNTSPSSGTTLAQSRSTRVLAPSRPSAELIETGKAVGKELQSGEVHRYRIELGAGQVALGVVMQNGIDLAVSTIDPSGRKLAEFDSPNGDKGPEPFIIESAIAGAYGLEVRAFIEPGAEGSQAPAKGRYEAKLDEIVAADVYAERRAKERIASARILEVWRDARAKRWEAVDKFWIDLKGKAPIVEPYPGDPKSVLVTFVFRSSMPYVALLGVMDYREKPMVRIGDSDLWYLSARLPADSRFDYAFIPAAGAAEFTVPFAKERAPDPRWAIKQLDPNNPATRFGMSSMELPDAPPQLWIGTMPDVMKGTVATIEIDSARMKEKRKIGIYTPADYDPKRRYPLLIAFDGETYGMDATAQMPMPTILDNMIAAKKIPPVVMALVANQGTRNRDLPGSPDFAAFVAKELVPKMRASYRAGMTPADTIVTGSSFGGLASMYIGLHHSDVIGNVLAQSPSFQFVRGSIGTDVSVFAEGGFMMREVAAAAKKPLRIYMDCGLFEGSLRDSNRHMRDVLVAKGYPVTYVEFSGGHDYWLWRGTISDGLVGLLQRQRR